MVNDPFSIILINPLATSIFLLTGGVTTLLIATKGNCSILFENKAFILGDLIAIPMAGYLAAFFYVPLSPATENFLPWNALSLSFAIAVALFFGFKYGLISQRWVPHGIFFILAAYIFINFLTRTFYQLIATDSRPLLIPYLIIMLLLLTHLIVGRKWPKKF